MIFLRRLLPSSAVVLGLAIAALTVSCKDKPAENAADASAPPVASSVTPAASAPAGGDGGRDGGAEEGRRGDRGPGHGGPSAMLFQAARSLDLKDHQKAKIDAAEKTAHEGAGEASREAIKEAAKGLHTDLVAGIKAGKIDAAKLEPRYAAIEKVAAAAHAKEAEALNALHAALDATQRKATVANVRAKQALREEKMAHRGNKDDAGADGGAGKGFGEKRSLGRLTRGLVLDADQQKKVDAIAAKDEGKGGHPDLTEMKKSVEALLGAFEKDTFDATKVNAFDAKKARVPMEQETKVLAQLVPILKPEQREKLAAKMESGPSPHGRRGAFGHRPTEDDGDDD